MDKHYGPSIPHLNSLSLSSHVKDGEVHHKCFSEDGNVDEKVLNENANHVINQILQESVQEENINDVSMKTISMPQMRHKYKFKILLFGHLMTLI